jgi:hypothetical protein
MMLPESAEWLTTMGNVADKVNDLGVSYLS